MRDPQLLLRSIKYTRPDALGSTPGHPFDLALLEDFDQLPLASPISFLVGDNGCGKSTLLNGIAANAALPTIGTARAEQKASAKQTAGAKQIEGAQLASQLTLVKSRPLRHGCYFRADQVALFVQGIERAMAQHSGICLLYTSPSPRDQRGSRMPSSA